MGLLGNGQRHFCLTYTKFPELTRFTLILFCVLWICCGFLHAQSTTTDSLLQRLNRIENGTTITSDSAKAGLLYQLSSNLQYTNPDSALVFAKRALEIAPKTKSPDLRGKINHTIGAIYYITGDYDQAMPYIMKATMYFRTSNNVKMLSRTFNNEGLIYGAFDEHLKALEIYEQALSMAKKATYSKQIANIYYNMGISHKDLNNNKEAVKHFEKSLKISRQLNYELTIARNLNFLAEIYIEQNNPDSASSLLFEAEELLDKTNLWDLAFTYGSIAKYYNVTGQWNKAIEYGEKSYRMATEIEAKWELQRITGILSTSFAQTGDYQKAYQYQTEHTRWNKSVYNKTREQNLARLRLAQQEARNSRLETQNKLQQTNIHHTKFVNTSLIIFIVFIGFVAFWSFRNIKRFRQLNKELQISNEIILQAKKRIEKKNDEQKKLIQTKNRILSIISHDARGPIANLHTLINFVEDRDVSKKDLTFLLQNIRKNLRQTTQMFDNIMHWARSQFDSFNPDIKPINLNNLNQCLINECSSNYAKKEVLLVNCINKNLFVKADKELLTIILRNLLSNALKFTEPGDTVELHARETKDHCVDISVKDTGIGIAGDQIEQILSGQKFTRKGTDNETGSGFGLTICRDFAQLMDGELCITGMPGKGTHVTVSLPQALKNKKNSVRSGRTAYSESGST